MMMTGYTNLIYSGNVNSLKEFAVKCARNFGVCVEFQDEPLDKDIVFSDKVDDYYIKQLEKAKKEYDDAVNENRTKEMGEEYFSKMYNDLEKKYMDEIHKNADFVKKCESILEKAKSWNPPTSEHKGIKDFMIEQLDGVAIDAENTAKMYHEILEEEKRNKDKTIREYINCVEEINRLNYAEEQIRKEKKRISKRNDFMNNMIKSIEAHEKE